MKKILASLAAIMLVAAATTLSADVDLKGIKCVVAGSKSANLTKSADFKDGKVYFCCDGCAGKFAKDSKPFTEKANHQLVATKQYEQKKCPFSGGDVDASTAVKLVGAKVAFCCNNCKGKVENAKDDAAKLKLVFNDKSFKKGFAKTKAE